MNTEENFEFGREYAEMVIKETSNGSSDIGPIILAVKQYLENKDFSDLADKTELLYNYPVKNKFEQGVIDYLKECLNQKSKE